MSSVHENLYLDVGSGILFGKRKLNATFHQIMTIMIKNWIIRECNSRVFIGLAIVGYQSLYHKYGNDICSTDMASAPVYFWDFFSFSPFSIFFGAF